MRMLLLLSLIFGSVNTQAAELEGTYVGCGVSSAFGPAQAIFHLVKMRTGFGENDFQYAAAFGWYGKENGDNFFPKVTFNADGTKMLMKIEVNPKVDYGLIVKSLYVEVQPDGETLVGSYRANSTQADGLLLSGDWTAKRLDTNKIPKLNCR